MTDSSSKASEILDHSFVHLYKKTSWIQSNRRTHHVIFSQYLFVISSTNSMLHAKAHEKYKQVNFTQIWLWRHELRSCKQRSCFVVFCFKTAWNFKSRRWFLHMSCSNSFESITVHQESHYYAFLSPVCYREKSTNRLQQTLAVITCLIF